jgi:hypothetical protein
MHMKRPVFNPRERSDCLSASIFIDMMGYKGSYGIMGEVEAVFPK